MNCFHCGRKIATKERIGFRDRCPACDWPAHACLNCGFYDPAYNNQCRETQAERVVDKDRANFCELFTPGKSEDAKSPPAASEAKAKLESLFKKKP